MCVNEKKKKSLYSLAKYPTYEILMEGQMASAGAHQAKFIEKLKKNKNYIKNQSIALKTAFSVLFLFLPLLPLVIYFQITENIGTISINTMFFVSSFLFMIFFGMVLMYMLMFGMISTGSFMSGNAFKWLQTLPFSKKKLKKIGFMTVFRSLDYPLIILIMGFPIIMVIATQDIFMFFICLLVSIVNVILSFSILVIVGEKMSILFSESKAKSKNVNLIRTITMLGYFIIIFGTSFLFSWGISAIESLLTIFATNEPPFILIVILSLIPFLFAPAFLVSLNTLQAQVNPILILTTLTGFALSIILTWLIFRFAQKALRSAISSEVKTVKVEKREIHFELKPTSPIKAYIRKDLVSSTRDIQSFMFIFFPIFYPLIMILSIVGLFNEMTISIEAILMIWSIILMLYLVIPIMLIVGFLNIEESGSSTLASLPLLPRDQAKAKIYLMLALQGISLLITSVVLALILQSILPIILLLITLPIAWILLLFIFVLKIKFFGQMKYKYIIEELHKENKILKWIAMIFSCIGLYLTILIIGNILIYFFGITVGIIVLGVIGILGLALMVFIFNKMFPKGQKVANYKTGGFLRNNPILGGIVLTLLYTFFLYLAGFAEGLVLLPFINILTLNDYTFLLFLDFFFQFGFLAVLLFLIVPKGLKLPDLTYSLKDYTEIIHLRPSKPIIRNILVGVGSFIIFSIVVLIGAITLGHYVFDPRILFGNPEPTGVGFGGLGWFLFIIMLIPGIWEEIAYRGVLIPMLVKKYHIRTSLIISSAIFGFAHTFNIISYILIGLDPLSALISVSFQVIYATFLGLAFGYLYIKTKTLLPSIILHFLINSVGQIFFNTYITDVFLAGIFLICFLGLIPAIFIILFVKVVIKQKLRNQDFLEIPSF